MKNMKFTTEAENDIRQTWQSIGPDAGPCSVVERGELIADRVYQDKTHAEISRMIDTIGIFKTFAVIGNLV